MFSKIKRGELFNLLILALFVLVINLNPLLVNAAVYSSSSSYEQHRVNNVTKDYLTDSSEHFIYKYTEDDKDVVDIIKRVSEKDYMVLKDVFGQSPKDKITIIIFSSTKMMNDALKLPQDQRAMGLYYCGFVSVLSPKAWIEGDNFEEIFNDYGPVLHELTHLFVDIKTNGNYPAWFTEGVALYFEKQINGVEWDRGNKNATYTIDQLTNDFVELDSDSAYRKSFEIIEQYVSNNSLDKLLNIMDRLGEGYSLENEGNYLV